MISFGRTAFLAILAIGAQIAAANAASPQDDQARSSCNEDAMLVFDASGSMSGDGWGYGSENPTAVSRMDKVRSALAKILPSATRFRRVGLITYGPGPYDQCNVKLELPPEAQAADKIMTAVNSLIPAGKTPLTEAVRQAADALHYRDRPGVIVVMTDGEETCGGAPCDLGKLLHAEAARLTIHVISIRVKGLSWTGEQSIAEARCLAEHNGGLYLTAESEQELIAALEKTLGCPMVTQGPAP